MKDSGKEKVKSDSLLETNRQLDGKMNHFRYSEKSLKLKWNWGQQHWKVEG